MSIFSAFTCILCQAQAVSEHHPQAKLKHIICPNCTEYVLEQNAEEWFARASDEPRLKFAEHSRNNPKDMVTLISMPPSSEVGVINTVCAEWLPIEQALHREKRTK